MEAVNQEVVGIEDDEGQPVPAEPGLVNPEEAEAGPGEGERSNKVLLTIILILMVLSIFCIKGV
jgi:hypothetical protein